MTHQLRTQLPYAACFILSGLIFLSLVIRPPQPTLACSPTAAPAHAPSPTPGPAPTPLPTPDPQMLIQRSTAQADLIVLGEITAYSVGHMVVAVEEYWRGPQLARSLDVVFPTHGSDCRANPELSKHDRVLLFLHMDARPDSAHLDEHRLLVDDAFLIITGDELRSAVTKQSFGQLSKAKIALSQTGPSHRLTAISWNLVMITSLVLLVAGCGTLWLWRRARRKEN